MPVIGLFSQDTTWKNVAIDEYLYVSLPGRVDVLDTFAIKDNTKARFRIYTVAQELFSITVMVTSIDDGHDENTPSKRQRALKEFAKGSMQSFVKKGFTCTTSDTFIRRMNCKKFVCKSPEAISIKNFIFFAKNKGYSLMYIDYANEDKARLNSFLKSIQFDKTIVESQQFDSVESSTAYKFGYYSVPAIIGIVVVVFILRRNKRKNEKLIKAE